MIQILAVKRSFYKENDGHIKARCSEAAAKVIDLEPSDYQLLEAVAKKDTPELHIEVCIEDLEMVMTRMHENIVPEKTEVQAVFTLADVENPKRLLNVNELESAMRFWRLLIPERERINEALEGTQFGITNTEHVANMKMLLEKLNNVNVDEQEVNDVLELVNVNKDGSIDRESASSSITMDVLVRILNKQHEEEEREQEKQDQAQKPESQQEVANQLSTQTSTHSNNDISEGMQVNQTAVKSSGPCCSVS